MKIFFIITSSKKIFQISTNFITLIEPLRSLRKLANLTKLKIDLRYTLFEYKHKYNFIFILCLATIRSYKLNRYNV